MMLLLRTLLALCAWGASAAVVLDRADFTPIVALNRIYAIGGTTTTMDIPALDFFYGIDINDPIWVNSHAPLHPFLQSFEHGVAYKGAGDLVFIQAGGGSTSEMEDIVTYDLALGRYDFGSRTVEQSEAPAFYRMTATLNPATNVSYYYGGVGLINHKAAKAFYNTFSSFDTSTRLWRQLKPTYPDTPRPARASHTANLINHQLFVMGGITFGANTSDTNTKETKAGLDSVLVYDIEADAAMAVAAFGEVPSPRLSYSATEGLDGHSIVIYGGYTDSTSTSVTMADTSVYVLDTCTLKWTRQEVQGTGPPALYGHSATTLNDYMVIMMGKTDQRTFSQKVYVLDMKHWKWVTSIGSSHIHSTTAAASCRFSLPDAHTTNKYLTEYDYSVLENPLREVAPAVEEKKTEKGLGIGFGLFALALIGVGVFFYLRRQRKKARTLNPRWIRSPAATPDATDYPLFVYNKEIDANNPNNPNYRNTAFAPHNTKAYTAQDQEQWEHQIHEDNPWHGPSNPRHTDVWNRMRGLNDASVISDEEVRNQTRRPSNP